jgi:hypothetical protein
MASSNPAPSLGHGGVAGRAGKKIAGDRTAAMNRDFPGDPGTGMNIGAIPAFQQATLSAGVARAIAKVAGWRD